MVIELFLGTLILTKVTCTVVRVVERVLEETSSSLRQELVARQAAAKEENSNGDC